MNETTLNRPALLSRPLPILIFILVAVAIDQIVKIAVDRYLPLQEAVPMIPMLALYRTYNLGVAFSMLAGALLSGAATWIWLPETRGRTV